jgi:hypothetical protein
VVFGYGVGIDAAKREIRVAPGHALDRRGRDLVLETPQCLGLPAWWDQQRGTDAFADLAGQDDVTFDADVLLGYRTCLARPVPAIADPCAGQATDIAYSRICEQVSLTLVRRPAAAEPAPPPPPYRLLRRLAGLTPADAADPDEAGLAAQRAALDGLAEAARRPAAAALWRQAAARAAAATADPTEPPAWTPPPDLDGLEDRSDCLVLARLSGVRLTRTDAGWDATVAGLAIDGRMTLLPTQALQALPPPLPPPPAAGPRPVPGSLSLAGSALTLRFDKPLAPASAAPAAFAVAEFDAATGWAGFALPGVTLADADQAVTLTLDRAPTGQLLRVTAFGRGPTPLLGADLIPAGAATAAADGSDQSLTLPRS